MLRIFGGLMAVLEDGLEDRGMEGLHIGSPVRVNSANICKMSILGKGHRKCMRVVLVPRVQQPIHRLRNGCSVFVFLPNGFLLRHGRTPNK